MTFPETIKVYNTAKKCVASYTLKHIQNEDEPDFETYGFINVENNVFGHIIFDDLGYVQVYAIASMGNEKIGHQMIYYAYVGDADRIPDEYVDSIGQAMYRFQNGPNLHPSLKQKETFHKVLEALKSGKLNDEHQTVEYEIALLDMAEQLASFYLDMTTQLLEIHKEALQTNIDQVEHSVDQL